MDYVAAFKDELFAQNKGQFTDFINAKVSEAEIKVAEAQQKVYDAGQNSTEAQNALEVATADFHDAVASRDAANSIPAVEAVAETPAEEAVDTQPENNEGQPEGDQSQG